MSEDREGYGAGSACTDESCALQLAMREVFERQDALTADNRALQTELAGTVAQLWRLTRTSAKQKRELLVQREEYAAQVRWLKDMHLELEFQFCALQKENMRLRQLSTPPRGDEDAP